ncbi:MAG: hypothetical protein IPJ07_26980 [Acidobacteria bacterium]|nr:hypothetical protein [Acidobacteriota bacterium]
MSRMVISDPGKADALQPGLHDPAVAHGSKCADTPNARRLREYRTTLGKQEYRILRGEFHRHTEISMDGGSDGSIWDSFPLCARCFLDGLGGTAITTTATGANTPTGRLTQN